VAFGDDSDGLAFIAHHYQRANTVVGQGFRSVSDGSRGLYGADGRTLAGQDGVNGQARLLGYTGARSASLLSLNRVRWPGFFPQARYVDAESPCPPLSRQGRGHQDRRQERQERQR